MMKVVKMYSFTPERFIVSSVAKVWLDMWADFNLEEEKEWKNEWKISKQKTKSSHSIFFENDHIIYILW